MGLAVAEIARRRADQFCDFVGVLKLGAIDLDAGAGIAKQSFSERLDNASLAGSGRAQKQQIANRASGGIQSRQEHLINLDDLFYRCVLANNLSAEAAFEVPSV